MVVLDSQRDVLDGPLKIPNETYMIPNVFRKITVTHTMKKCFLLETTSHTNCIRAIFLWLSKERVSTEFLQVNQINNSNFSKRRGLQIQDQERLGLEEVFGSLQERSQEYPILVVYVPFSLLSQIKSSSRDALNLT